MEVYLIIKDGAVIAHTDLKAMAEIDGRKTPDKTVTMEAWEAAGSTAHILADGNIQLGIPAEEKAKKQEIETLTAEEKSLLKELADKDYQIIKCAERGTVLADVDPELNQRRDECRARIDFIRERLVELNIAA